MPEQRTEQFSVGETCYLKSGSPQMTIIKIKIHPYGRRRDVIARIEELGTFEADMDGAKLTDAEESELADLKALASDYGYESIVTVAWVHFDTGMPHEKEYPPQALVRKWEGIKHYTKRPSSRDDAIKAGLYD